MRLAADRDPGDSQEADVREDTRLLRRIADEDPRALAALYRRRGGLLYSLLVRMLVNEMEAQEVMQDAFVHLWRRAHEYEPERSSAMGWIIMIARGLAQSAELRALVGELEEGAMALSMTPPRRRPPQEVWRRIEKSVTGQTRWKLAVPSIWVGWWRHGWAAAAACLAGWLLYALWVNWPRSSGAVSAPVASEV
ncbi:MAG TPA: sigma factor, partial [Candidatus Binatia bacterium]|nr:sigma factor [Candidatus Binatia bacterium]